MAELLWNRAENIESCRVVNFDGPENHKIIFLKLEKKLGGIIFLGDYSKRDSASFLYFAFCCLNNESASNL